MSPFMEDKAIEKIRQELAAWVKEKDASQSDVARGCGISTTAVSQFLSNTYAGNMQKLAEKAKAFLARQQKSGKILKRELVFVKTSVAKKMEAAVDFAYRGKIVVAWGNSGIGKTSALRNIVAQDPTLIYLQVARGWSAFNVLGDLCDVLNIECKRTLPEMLKYCVGKLRDTGRLLIIDEAEYLKISCLDIVRRLHDFAGIGILLVGMPQLNTQFRDLPTFKQIDNRVRLRVKLDNISLEDAKDIIAAQVPECQKVAGTLYELCRGDARRLESLLDNVLQLVSVHSLEISKDLCEEAERFLGEGG